MRVGVNDGNHLKIKGVEFVENGVRVAAWIDHKGFMGDRVADDGAIALQRPDGKGFPNKGAFRNLGLNCHQIFAVASRFGEDSNTNYPCSL